MCEATEFIITSRIKIKDAAKLQDEYAKLVEGLQDAELQDEDAIMGNPVLPDDLLSEAIPGNIRKAEHFVAFLKRFVEYLKVQAFLKPLVNNVHESRPLSDPNESASRCRRNPALLPSASERHHVY